MKLLSIFFILLIFNCEAISSRQKNIELMRDSLKNPYKGYDIIIISSTSKEEAYCQQQNLEKAFIGNPLIILSVVDSTESGQLIGSVYTWLQAEELMHEKYPKLLPQKHSLLDYVRANHLKVALFHNGGKGERCSPLTQSLGNSRGALKLVGSITNACDNEVELDVLLGVVLQCSSFAITNLGTHIDTFWTSQIAFGSNPHDELVRSNYGIDKFLVGFDKEELIPQNIADFGTAALSSNGRMTAFYGNKRFAVRKGTEYVIDIEKIRNELLNKGERVAYDFGSFSTSFDMWQLIVDYWTRKVSFDQGKSTPKMKRDIDPHFIQPFIRFLNGMNDLTDPYMNEVIEFYILYRNTKPFENLEKIFGYIDLGNDTLWFRYRRPIDIMNEKFEMLTDLKGNKMEMELNGTLRESQAIEKQKQISREARQMRGISDDAIAVFTVEGKQVTLSFDEVKAGKLVEGVFIKDSIVQKSDLTKGSSIINSVVNDTTGKVFANFSYLDSVSAPSIQAVNSVVHQVIDQNEIIANTEVVSDVFRTKINPFYHGRMRAHIGYDPKGTSINDTTARTEDGRFTFDQIREIEPLRISDDEFRNSLKAKARRK
jgi:hypothetical protein